MFTYTKYLPIEWCKLVPIDRSAGTIGLFSAYGFVENQMEHYSPELILEDSVKYLSKFFNPRDKLLSIKRDDMDSVLRAILYDEEGVELPDCTTMDLALLLDTKKIWRSQEEEM